MHHLKYVEGESKRMNGGWQKAVFRQERYSEHSIIEDSWNKKLRPRLKAWLKSKLGMGVKERGGYPNTPGRPIPAGGKPMKWNNYDIRMKPQVEFRWDKNLKTYKVVVTRFYQLKRFKTLPGSPKKDATGHRIRNQEWFPKVKVDVTATHSYTPILPSTFIPDVVPRKINASESKLGALICLIKRARPVWS